MKGVSVGEVVVGGDGEGGGVGVVKFGVALGSFWLMVKVFFCICFLILCFYCSLFFFRMFCAFVRLFVRFLCCSCFVFSSLRFVSISSCFLRPYFFVGSARPLVPFSDGLYLSCVRSFRPEEYAYESIIHDWSLLTTVFVSP